MNDSSVTIGPAHIELPPAESVLTGIAAKGAEIVLIMLAEEIGAGWRFGDALTLTMQIVQNLPPGQAAHLAVETLERVLHNSFVKARIPPYDVSPPPREEIGP